MTTRKRDRIGIVFINRMSILILASGIALNIYAGCRQGPERGQQKPVPPATETEESAELCGECLELPEAAVCTVNGATLRNSCEAICRGERILCNSECPCPGEDDPAAANETADAPSSQ